MMDSLSSAAAWQRACVATFTVGLAAVATVDVRAHEYWIEPLQYRVILGAPLQAELKNGEDFKGMALPFMPPRFDRFSIDNASGNAPVTGVLGDLPALQQPSETTGAHVLAYQGKPETLRYSNYEKFTAFVRKEGIEWVLDAHRQRGLTTLSIQEAYRRFAKALITVAPRQDTATEPPTHGGKRGDARMSPAVQDSQLGMEFEIVLQTPGAGLRADADYQATVYYQQQPASDIQVSVFTKRDGLLARYRSDASGQIRFRVPTAGAVLLSAVQARVPAPALQQQTGAAWETLWASLTFRTP